MTKHKRKLIQNVLRRTLKIFGPNGEHWTRRNYRNWVGNTVQYCMLGALNRATRSDKLYCTTCDALISEGKKQHNINFDIIKFNDTRKRKFGEIRNLFQQTIKSLEKEI